MGGTTSSAKVWTTHSQANTGATHQQTFTARTLHPDLDPGLIKNGWRESRDSPANPASSPLVIGLDQTGSMGHIPQYMLSPDGMPVIFDNIYTKKPISDPHILFAAIGDAETGEQAPLQVTQFEADINLIDQLKKVWVVGNGGGNGSESYPALWHFCANHTVSDSFEKRQRKGFLWTIGDDAPPRQLTPVNLARIYVPGYYAMTSGEKQEAEARFSTLSLQQLHDMACRQWHVFHIHVQHGGYGGDASIIQQWKNILGERALVTDDYKALSEIIVSTMQMVAGSDLDTVVNAWSGSKAVAVRATLHGFNPAVIDPGTVTRYKGGSSPDVVAF